MPAGAAAAAVVVAAEAASAAVDSRASGAAGGAICAALALPELSSSKAERARNVERSLLPLLSASCASGTNTPAATRQKPARALHMTLGCATSSVTAAVAGAAELLLTTFDLLGGAASRLGWLSCCCGLLLLKALTTRQRLW